jgi:hypothetical protein
MQQMFDSQKEAVAALHSSKLLLGRVGSGKTRIALEVLKRRQLLMGPKPTLVLGTLRIAANVWPEQATKWWPGLDIKSIAGLSPSKRERVLLSHPQALTCNYENLVWLVNQMGERLPELFPQLVIDESSRLRTPGRKAFDALAPLLPRFEFVLPMSASPRPNYLWQIWGQVYLVDQGERLGRYRDAFLQRYFRYVQIGRHGKWVPYPDTEAVIFEKIKDIVHVVRPDSQSIVTPREIDLELDPPRDVVQYMRQADEARCSGEDYYLPGGGGPLVLRGSRVPEGYLQLSSGAIYRQDNTVQHLHAEKMDLLDEVVQEMQGEPLIVVYQYIHERDRIMHAYPEARLLDERKSTEDEWNAGEIPILLLHPRGGGHGLNLQHGGSTQFWFTPTFDAELYRQTVGRTARTGQTQEVRILRAIMRGTEDRRAYDEVSRRMLEEDRSMGCMRED